MGVPQLGLEGRPAGDVLVQITTPNILLKTEVEGVLQHLKLQVAVGIPPELLDIKDNGDIAGEVGEGLRILLPTVVEDGPAQGPVGRDVTVGQEEVEVRQLTTDGLPVDEEDIEVGSPIGVTLEGDAVVLKAPLKLGTEGAGPTLGSRGTTAETLEDELLQGEELAGGGVPVPGQTRDDDPPVSRFRRKTHL